MKKFVALLLGSAMLVSAFAGLVACKPDSPSDHTEHVDVDPKDGKCDVCGKDMSETPGPQGHTTHPDANFDGECDVGGTTPFLRSRCGRTPARRTPIPCTNPTGRP